MIPDDEVRVVVVDLCELAGLGSLQVAGSPLYTNTVKSSVLLLSLRFNPITGNVNSAPPYLKCFQERGQQILYNINMYINYICAK